MNLGEALAGIKSIKPSQYDDEQLVRWLGDMDAKVYRDTICHYEDAPAAPVRYSVDEPDAALMIPEPYSDVYIKWLGAQIDYCNAEFDRYNNAMVMYNVLLGDYLNDYNRTHTHKQSVVRV